MCGIAGVVSLKNDLGPDSVKDVQGMIEKLRHRGPDGHGINTFPRCVLGNTRLKIIDLSENARMPMSNEDGSIWITYNGEVTNYKELIKEYSLGVKHNFKSTSDTEVVIHLYEELGISCLSKLNGMFAFTLYDARLKKVYIVRDFFGLRPLFYYIHEGLIYFSSEIKGFLDIPSFKNDLNYEGLYHYFSLAYIPDTMTPFANVQELQGSHMLEIDLQKSSYSLKKYYNISYNPDNTLNYEDTTRNLHDVMYKAMERNLFSDVPLGLTLSGGVDTSSLLALAKEMGVSQTLHTYSIRMAESSFDESRYQRIMANFAKPIHHEITVTPDMVIQKLVEHTVFMDEPSADGAAIPSYILAEEAKKEVKVLLSGEGGDEVFNAYETHRAYNIRKMYLRCVPKPVRDMISWAAEQMPVSYEKLSFDFLAKRFTKGAEFDTAGSHFYWRHMLDAKEKKELMPAFSTPLETADMFRNLFNSLPFDDLNRVGYIDLIYYFIGDLMVKNDRTFMAHSVEARFPYMDRELFEFAGTLPDSFKTSGFKGRRIQKDAMKKILPKEIYNRTNMGLEMPHSLWFMKGFKPLGDMYFTKARIERTNFISYKKVLSLWQEHMDKKRDNGRTLWGILTFLVWFDLFVDTKNYKNYL